MKHRWLAFLAAPALVAAAPAAASLAEVSAHFAALGTMKAAFTQTAASGQVARGTLTLARPGRVRFQYEASVPLLIVADGRTLSMIDYEVAQVSKWPIRATPLAILLDPQVNVRKYGRLLTGANAIPGFVSVEARDPKHPEYGALTLYFQRSSGAPGGLSLSAWRALDAQGNVTQVQLTDVRYGGPVAANAFAYRDPRRTAKAPGKG
jgi:outer membrane lipoprotein-sorting protein